MFSGVCQTEPTEAPPAGFKPSWFASYAAIKAATADPASSRLTRLEAAHEVAYVQLATDEIPVGAYRICAYNTCEQLRRALFPKKARFDRHVLFFSYRAPLYAWRAI